MFTPIFEIFELRKNGELESAYKAACGNYVESCGHYTTLCMFWCALDYARYLMENGRVAECPCVIGKMVDAYRYLADHTGRSRVAANQLLTQYYAML